MCGWGVCVKEREREREREKGERKKDFKEKKTDYRLIGLC